MTLSGKFVHSSEPFSGFHRSLANWPTKDVLGMYCVLRDRKEIEIRVLQDTVEELQAELARKEGQSKKRHG
jgi:hypothetical protein